MRENEKEKEEEGGGGGAGGVNNLTPSLILVEKARLPCTIFGFFFKKIILIQ